MSARLNNSAKNFQRVLMLVVAFWLIIGESPARADTAEVYVPPALEPWAKWVLERNPDRLCPVLNSTKRCFWPGRLQIRVTANGATFRYVTISDQAGKLSLPGDSQNWPIDVQVSGPAASDSIVLDSGNHPVLKVGVGKYEVSGRFVWQSMPKSLRIPSEAGLVSLAIDGKDVDRPKLSANGELWLQQETKTETAEENSLRIEVSRNLKDGLPFNITTSLQLRVAGKARELPLGKPLFPNSTPLRITSDLSYKLDSDGGIILQARPGVHNVLIESVMAAPPTALQIPKGENPAWPDTEYWVWQGDESWRSVELRGGTPIEAERTTLPDEWRRYPSYVMSSDQTIEFVETRRGEKEVLPNQISLERQLWLDLDGNGLTLKDSLKGTVNQAWRLNVLSGLTLERVVVQGSDQLITKDISSELPGVELRQQNLFLEAELRSEGSVGSLPAIGWDHDVTGLSWTLATPPGWRLLDASGPDVAPGSWVSKFRLWDFFFIGLFAIASAKLFGPKWGVLAFLLMVLCHGEPNAPRFSWVNLLGVLAILKVLPETRFRNYLQGYFIFSALIVALFALPFIFLQIRNGLFPQLAQMGSPYQLNIEFLAVIFALVIGVSWLIAFVSFVARRLYRYAFLTIIVGPLLLGLSAIFLTFLGRPAAVQFQSTSGSVSDTAYLEMNQIPQPAPAESDEFLEESYPTEQDRLATSVFERRSKKQAFGKVQPQKQALLQVDPNAVVQTGSGIPNWQWQTYSFRWNGPVAKDQTVSLYLLGPKANLFLSLVRVLLIVIFFLAIVRLRAFGVHFGKTPATLLVIFGLGFAVNIPAAAEAQNYPPAELLQDLETRLTSRECQENCLTTNSLRVELQCQGGDPAGELRVEAKVSSDGLSAWAIPGPVDQFSPVSVKLDDSETDALRRDESGLLWVRVPRGSHRIVVRGRIRNADTVTLQLGLAPKHVEACVNGFTVDGISPTGTVENSIQLVRIGDAKLNGAAAEEAEVLLGDWFMVQREITVGVPWSATTTVSRLGSSERAQLVKVPIFAGELVEDSRFKVEGGQVLVSFGRDESSVTWASGIREQAELDLVATANQNFTEVWRVRCATVWRCDAVGPLPSFSVEGGEALTQWAPWPGESLKLKIAKPLGVPGQVETVDSVRLNWLPGLGLLSADLQLDLRSSQIGSRKIALPEGAILQEVQINAKKRNLVLEDGVLVLPVVPGKSQYKILWQQPWQQSVVSRMPSVDVGGPVTNLVVTVKVPDRRWLLWVGGPAWGPVVLFWGALLVTIGIALIADRLKLAPLRLGEWIFLGLGLTVHHPLLLLLPAAWFYANQRRRQLQTSSRWVFNSVQIGLVLFSVLVFSVFLVSIYRGLIISPDVGVVGGGSNNSLLRWYVDRQGSKLSEPLIVSFPLWAFQMFIFVWASWLVFALLRWLKWGWDCFSQGGLWRAKSA